MRCKGCQKTIRTGEAKVCQQCAGNYHYQCLGISTDNFNKESKQAKASWKCPECKEVTKRGDNSNTPIRSQASSASPKSPVQTEVSNSSEAMEDLKKYFEQKLNEATNKILTDVRNRIAVETKTINDTIESLKTSVDFVHSQYDDLNKRFNEKVKLLDHLQNENASLRGEVREMNAKLAVIEQQARECNVEVQCVPERRDENILATVKLLSKTVGEELADSDILNFHRVPKVNPESTRPRAIVVKLANPRTRDGLLAAVRRFNKAKPTGKLNTHHLGLTDSSPVYVVEHLSPANKRLHAAARAAARDKKYSFVWVRNGRIFVRKDENSKAKLIDSQEALDSLPLR